MVQASVRGWQHYLESPKAANEYIHQLNPQMGLDVLEYGAKAIDLTDTIIKAYNQKGTKVSQSSTPPAKAAAN
jgi:16S rRNA A1518/A1519 N6-dimethyltransferase RsmA/KsgA/DIM1 with predicted DNA glycosylase/AP lyase activity